MGPSFLLYDVYDGFFLGFHEQQGEGDCSLTQQDPKEGSGKLFLAYTQESESHV